MSFKIKYSENTNIFFTCHYYVDILNLKIINIFYLISFLISYLNVHNKEIILNEEIKDVTLLNTNFGIQSKNILVKFQFLE